MAKLNEARINAAFEKRGTLQTIGHNRALMVTDDGVAVGFLHGSRIFAYYEETATLALSSCGYPTTTTRAALTDFQRAVFGETVAPCSMAGGNLSAHCVALSKYGIRRLHVQQDGNA